MNFSLKTAAQRIQPSDTRKVRDANQKFIQHIAWIVIGIIVSVVTMYLPLSGLLVHLSPIVIAQLPPFATEIADRIHFW
jgi:cytochrome c biogenesis protein CcdA